MHEELSILNLDQATFPRQWHIHDRAPQIAFDFTRQPPAMFATLKPPIPIAADHDLISVMIPLYRLDNLTP